MPPWGDARLVPEARTIVLAYRLQTTSCRTCTGGPTGTPEHALEPPLTRLVQELEGAETEIIQSSVATAEGAFEEHRTLSVIRQMLAIVRGVMSITTEIKDTKRGGHSAAGREK